MSSINKPVAALEDCPVPAGQMDARQDKSYFHLSLTADNLIALAVRAGKQAFKFVPDRNIKKGRKALIEAPA